MSVTLIIRQQADAGGSDLVARVEGYDGPVPRMGDYIFHPDLNDDGVSDLHLHSCGVMSVKTVTHGILTRPRNGEEHFVGRPVQVIEVWV